MGAAAPPGTPMPRATLSLLDGTFTPLPNRNPRNASIFRQSFEKKTLKLFARSRFENDVHFSMDNIKKFHFPMF